MHFKPFPDDERRHMRVAHGPIFMTGQCVAFAIALHRRSGRSLVALRGAAGELQHAGVRDPDGAIRDARGSQTDAEFVRPWGGTVHDVDEATLLSEDPKIGPESIKRADDLLGLFFADMPGTSVRDEKLRAFADGLEALCRETGIWLRSDGPHGVPIYEAYGDEGEFAVSFDASGQARIDRTLGPDDGRD